MTEEPKHGFKFKSEFLNKYLDYVEDTETPRIMHVMSAIAGIAACLGRRVYIEDGHQQLFPNLYIALIGPAGVRKSTAISLVRQLLENTTIRFAPDDTGGQRQGLINALDDKNDKVEDEEVAKLASGIEVNLLNSLEGILGRLKVKIPDPRDRFVLNVWASEMHSFMGTASLDMMTFLNKMFDGEPYEYRTKTSRQILPTPLITFLSGNTPDGVDIVFPHEAIGHGLMSRILLVYASKIYKPVPVRSAVDKLKKAWLENKYKAINQFDGCMTFSPTAERLRVDLYYYKIKINDSRFDGYASRRNSVHLPKIAMCLAAARGDHQITTDDIAEAHMILEVCEMVMPDALGQFGMSKLARAKQKLLETLKYAQQAVKPELLFAMCHNDMTHREFEECIGDLINAKKILLVTTRDKSTGRNEQAYVFKDQSTSKMDELINQYGSELLKPEPPKLTLIEN